jgi:hypothetical protein
MVDRFGAEILCPRERRAPQMPNAIAVLVEQRIVAFALGFPGYGPAHIAAELRRPKWGGFSVSANGVWRVLRRHGSHTRALRCGLLAGYAAPPEPAREPEPERVSRNPSRWGCCGRPRAAQAPVAVPRRSTLRPRSASKSRCRRGVTRSWPVCCSS